VAIWPQHLISTLLTTEPIKPCMPTKTPMTLLVISDVFKETSDSTHRSKLSYSGTQEYSLLGVYINGPPY